MFEAAIVPATVFLVGVYFIPESLRWLAGQGDWARAKHVLIRFGGEKHALKTVGEMRTSFHAEANLSVRGALRNPRWLAVLGIEITLAVLQQWCGINVIFNYAQEVFSAAGYGRSAMSVVWPYPCCSNAITRW
jgi:SP family xylose:H+ symportor-like MFS transporter